MTANQLTLLWMFATELLEHLSTLTRWTVFVNLLLTQIQTLVFPLAPVGQIPLIQLLWTLTPTWMICLLLAVAVMICRRF